ncbi:glycosyl transferase [Methylobacterium organophilum]|uniref:Undecaprenyl-phosphate alpha-N-acetylglucosaminyl 1-phosphate transferase n=1 Tax=Methylobacterium organophilum TaxID=410 RepID=A0ABQ4T523_METOR|nr:glycosyl transferase [Methylobacterium organophilum]UMY19190.1 glycosyl transferase [Methylobacterium organophilum]GJE25341.1 Undecaprenyl-phosphate alpha-N-acetylglucosaminyl 1-phosphate transferase [Methylobacterium organophilum]
MTLAPLLAVPLACGVSAGLIVLLKPVLARYALARPNARSSHRVPTPQGGGIAIVAAALLVAVGFALSAGAGDAGFLTLVIGALVLAVIGAVDDIRPLSPALRFLLQALAVAAVVMAAGGRLLPEWPLWLERIIAVLAGLWFVNLVNFMDGLDWMTVAEMVPLSGFLVVLGFGGGFGAVPTLLAAGLLGGLLGFAPFNRPVARLFMGDVGSLPIGLLVAWLLYRLALEGQIVAALILPLYPVADATLTLLWRLKRGEKVWQAHRSHFYQVATVNGFSVPEVVGAVFALGLALDALAAASLLWPSWPVRLLCLAGALALVAALLRRFSRPKPSRTLRA